MDEQLANELSAIFSQCPKDSRGEVEVKKVIDVLTEKYGDSEQLKEFMINELDPDGLNEPISEERLQAIMKSIITSWEDKVFNCPASPLHPLYAPQYSSTPNVAMSNKRRRNLISEINEEPSEIITSSIEESGNSSGVASAIHKEIIVSLRVKVQELEERLMKAEMTTNSLELRLKKEFASTIALKKDNLKYKEELKRLQSLEEIKIEECNKVDSLEKQYERKCNDYDRVLKHKLMFEEKISDQKSEIKALTDKLNLAMKTINEQTNSNHLLSNELAQWKRVYEQLDADYKCQTIKLVSLEADHEALVDRISQVSNEKQDLQMKLAEMSVCHTITSCMNYSDMSCEALMSLTTNEIFEDKEDCCSLQKELEQRQVSLDCHSPSNSSRNSFSSRMDRFRDLTDAETQTDLVEMMSSQCVQTYLASTNEATQTELALIQRFGSCWPEFTTSIETQTEVSQISPLNIGSYVAAEAQTDVDMHSFVEPVAQQLSQVSTVHTQTDPDPDYDEFSLADTTDTIYEPDMANYTVFLTPLNMTREDEPLICRTKSTETTPWGTPNASPVLSRRQSFLNSYQSFDKSECTPLDSQLVLRFSDHGTGNELCISSRVSSQSSWRSEPSMNLIPDWPYRRYMKAAASVSAVFFVLLLIFIILMELTFNTPWGDSCSSKRFFIWDILQGESWVKIRYDGSPPM